MNDEGYASVKEHGLGVVKVPSKSRRRCQCGCKSRATHIGTANGMGMYSGCHQSVIIWKSTKGNKIGFNK